jgi:hypothetical protein
MNNLIWHNKVCDLYEISQLRDFRQSKIINIPFGQCEWLTSKESLTQRIKITPSKFLVKN